LTDTAPAYICTRTVPWCWSRVIDPGAECTCPKAPGHRRNCSCADCQNLLATELGEVRRRIRLEPEPSPNGAQPAPAREETR
jgi:hypothetical protein